MTMASQMPLSSPVAVVGPQFCEPYPVELTVTKKAPLSITNSDFVVTDVDGNVVFKVKRSFFSLRDRHILLDGAGNPLMTMQKKILTTHKRWNVFRGESTDPNDLLFRCKRSISLFQVKTKLDVFLATNTTEQADFKIKGSYFKRSCTIYLGNTETIIAQMSRKYTVKNILLGKGTFGVTAYPNVDYAFIVALIVILDKMKRKKTT